MNMVTAAISANPLKLDVRSHTKCLLICFVATVSTFQYGQCPSIWPMTASALTLSPRLNASTQLLTYVCLIPRDQSIAKICIEF